MKEEKIFIMCARVGTLGWVDPTSVIMRCQWDEAPCGWSLYVHPHSVEIALAENAKIVCNQHIAEVERRSLAEEGEPASLLIHPLQEPEFGEALRKFGGRTREEIEAQRRRR